jgi:hypothetical protein
MLKPKLIGNKRPTFGGFNLVADEICSAQIVIQGYLPIKRHIWLSLDVSVKGYYSYHVNR